MKRRDEARSEREPRMTNRLEEPSVPEGVTGRQLDPALRDELRSLSKDTAERTAQHMVTAMALFDEEPDLAVRHAQFAARIGGRVGATREVYGVLAYQAGDYRTAIRELRTSMRITGRYDVLPLVADSERGLGRPERALDIAASEESERLGAEATLEMMIVVAGAYADTGDIETALASLDTAALRQKINGRWHVRLWVAYADLLERAGQGDQARKWLTLAADADTDRITDAAERLGRPAPPVEVDPTWEDDEQISVVDAFAEEEPAEDIENSDDSDSADDVDDSVDADETDDAGDSDGVDGSGGSDNGDDVDDPDGADDTDDADDSADEETVTEEAPAASSPIEQTPAEDRETPADPEPGEHPAEGQE